MDKEDEIKAALQTLRDYQREVGRRRSRIHIETASANIFRMRAIEGICGCCPSLRIEFIYQDGRRCVALHCLSGRSPTNLYRQTPLGEQADCPCLPEQSRTLSLLREALLFQ